MFGKLVPQLTVNSIHDIDLERLSQAGIRGIITDLDNTLVGARTHLATPEVEQWIRHAERLGFKVMIVSNNHRTRVSRFSEPLQVPFLSSAGKPTLGAFRRAMKTMDTKPEQTAMIGDQLFTDILGGNRIGLYTILVMPVSLSEESWPTRINRILEKLVKRFTK